MNKELAEGVDLHEGRLGCSGPICKISACSGDSVPSYGLWKNGQK